MSDIDQKDLSPLIEIATTEKEQAEDRLTEQELDEIAAELGIDPEYIDDAQVILERRRQAEADEALAREKLRSNGLWIGAAICVLVAAGGAVSHNGLSDAEAHVARQKAQWHNVIERQVAVEKRVASQPQSRDKAAELAGAENRVRIERKRYDEAATQYNRHASGFPTGMWRIVFGFPANFPLSNAISANRLGGQK